ncbi:hypothetical protein FBY35_0483 [Streptomyces sp. SLBN-118]|nr:hypothetical protein FBY35_0483 [Streptomyces sp. SLBN-118]
MSGRALRTAAPSVGAKRRSQETQRVIDAVDAVEAMIDPEERAKAIGEVL